MASHSERSIAAPVDYTTRIAQEGHAVIPQVLSIADTDEICAAINDVPASEAVRQKQSVYGVRNLLETSPAIC